MEWTRRTYHRTRRLFVLSVIMALIATAVPTQSAQAGYLWSNELQIQVNLGFYIDYLYISKVRITGWNQHDDFILDQEFSQEAWTSSEQFVEGWWWKVDPEHGVLVELYIDGYGWRSCGKFLTAEHDPPYALVDTAYVIYRGIDYPPEERCLFWLI